MSMGLYIKIALITLALLVAVYLLSLFDLFTQLGRYESYWRRHNEKVQGKQIDYVALGDSTAQGIGASHPSSGYVPLIARELESRYDKKIRYVNLSKSGATIEQALSTQLPAMEKLKTNKNTLVTIQIGANDMAKFESDKFQREMDELMGKLPKQTLISDIPYFGDTLYKSREVYVIEANKIMRKLAKKHGFKLVPLHDTMAKKGDLRTLASDFFHPSNTAYRENWARVFIERCI